MRLCEIRMEKYGPFDALPLALDPRPGCINLIVAPNGAGKSVLRRAFGDLLFGIDAKTPMGFRFGYPGMRIAARACLADGTTLTFARRKGQGHTLLDENGAPLDPVRLGMLPDSDLFKRLFALDTTLLRSGGNALLDANGTVGSLLLAAAGLGGARSLAKTLERDSADITFVRKDAKSPFNLAITDFKESRRRADAALLRPRDWDKLEDAYQQSLAQREAARARARAAEAALDTIARIRAIRPLLHTHDAAAAWLAANPDAPNLPGDLRQRLTDSAHDTADTASRIQAGTQAAAALHAQLAETTVDTALLAAQDAVVALDGPAGAAAQALADLPGLQARHATALAEIRRLQRDMGETCAPEQAAAILPSATARDAAGQLLRGHDALAANAATTAAQHEKLKTALAGTTEALAALPAVAADAVLPALLRDIRAQGDPAGLASQTVQSLRAAEARLATAIAETPLWQGDAAGLAALRLRPMPAYAAADAALRAARDALRQRDDATTAARARHADAAATLAAATASAPIADRAAIAAARAHRDAGWRLIARLAFGGAPLTPAEQLGFAAGEHLALAYERSVAAADQLADLRADAGEAVARAVQARAALDAEAARLADAETKLTEAADTLAAAEAAWRAVLPAELPPTTSHEDLRAFMTGRAEVLRALEAVALARQAADARATLHAGWAARLARHLDSAETDLPALLREAETRLAQADRQAKACAELEAKAQILRAQLADAEADAAGAAEDLSAWQAAWHAALARLNRPEDETPAMTAAVLHRQGLLATAVEAAERHQERLDQITSHAAAFLTQLRQTLRAAGAEDSVSSPEQALAAARGLRQALDIARAAQARRGALVQQRTQAESALAQLRADEARHQANLDRVLAEIGASSPEAADARLALAEARASHTDARAQAAAAIARQAGGRTLDELRAETAAIPEPEMAQAELSARDEAAEAGAAREEAASRVTALRQQMDAATASSAYAEAVAAQNDAAARAAAVLQDALLLRLSQLLLTGALARFEAQSQPAQLRRIAAWFDRLTDGAFPSLGIDPDSDPPALLLHQAARPGEPKHVEDLSEGTRDQLFLALRLAAIETHPARLPFVADDILQSFDDTRAEAALHALLDLSQHVQVILLTHHHHIGALAARLPAGTVHLAALPETGQVLGVTGTTLALGHP